MLFNSVSYVGFLAFFAAVYWLLPRYLRQKLLLIASIVFYGLWRVEFVVLVIFSAFIDYFFSLKIYETKDRHKRLAYLVLSIATNIGLLAYFKYTYFILDNVVWFIDVPDAELRAAVGKIILPLGISFYTFLSISYTIDVYRREFTPIRRFNVYLTYVMFWPHMIAGPILRAHELVPQLQKQSCLNPDDIAAGLRCIIFGLLLKVGLADQIAPLVDDAFVMPPSELTGLDVLTMAFAFGLQIYFDFAGYSMIAVGSARLVGIIFPENFNWPYLSTSPREFWRRWHITLSSWIRDYLYLPLSGLREHSHSQGGIDIQFVKSKSTVRVTLALLLTWFLMGLWHGASWNFAFWGLWHATFILIYRMSNRAFTFIPVRIRLFFGWGITVVVVMLGWIFFRAATLENAFGLYGRLFDIRSYGALAFRENFYLITFVMFVGMVGVWWVTTTRLRCVKSAPMQALGEVGALAAAIFVVFIFLSPISQFIYFQF